MEALKFSNSSKTNVCRSLSFGAQNAQFINKWSEKSREETYEESDIEESELVPKRSPCTNTADMILQTQCDLCYQLSNFDAGENVKFTYNPLTYAAIPHENFVRKFCNNRKKILFLGMNPGPFGMAQTGVPFGDVSYVRDWLQIGGPVARPPQEHPKRKIDGFECKRSEVSGSRFWKFMKTHFKVPEALFSTSFIYNYCPLIFMNENGKNIVPGALPVAKRKLLYYHCDEALRRIVSVLSVSTVVGIGNFSCARAKAVLKSNFDISVAVIMHPSPASPAANKGWDNIALRQLKESGVWEQMV